MGARVVVCSKIQPKLKNDGRVCEAGVEDVDGGFPFRAGDADQEAALHVEAGLEGPCAFRHKANANPVGRRVCKLWPRVVKTPGFMGRVEYIFVRD